MVQNGPIVVDALVETAYGVRTFVEHVGNIIEPLLLVAGEARTLALGDVPADLAVSAPVEATPPWAVRAKEVHHTIARR